MPILKVMKTAMKKKKQPKYSHYSTTEKACLRRLQDVGKSATQVAALLGRDLSSVNRHFLRNTSTPMKAVGPVGRPRALTEKQVDRVATTTEQMVQAADKAPIGGKCRR